MKNTQISPFAITGRGYSNYKIQKPIRLIELFAGIGAQAKALEKLHVNFEHYKICEFDKYAVASYNAIHNTNFATSDITQLHANDLEIVDTDKYEYILTYSFPCQDLSLAGKQQGMKKGTQTRSGLLWEVERLLKECKELPQVLLMENVPQVHSSKNYEDFKEWQNFLSNLGYQNFWADLNAKNYGIPQNRNRTFMVSILGNSFYEFPEPFPLKLKLKDLLEDTVDEKYYLSEKQVNGIVNSSFTQKRNSIQNTECCGTLLARDRKDPKCVVISSSSPIKENTITTKDSIVAIKPNVEVKDKSGKKFVLLTNYKKLIETIEKNYLPNEVVKYMDLYNQNVTDNCGTLTNPCHNTSRLWDGTRIRKLTPKEYFRLMGFDDKDCEKASKVNSNTQLYKQAGNSIVVNVLVEIFRQMF